MAYSSRYTAEATPIGNENTTTNTPIQNVPRSAWNTPAACGVGAQAAGEEVLRPVA